MRVRLTGAVTKTRRMIESRLRWEGAEISDEGIPDLEISWGGGTCHSWLVVELGVDIPDLALQAWGLKLDSTSQFLEGEIQRVSNEFRTLCFYHPNTGIEESVLGVFGVFGLMNDGMGYPVIVGCGVHTLSSRSLVEPITSSQGVKDFLKNLGCTTVMEITWNTRGDLKGIRLGVSPEVLPALGEILGTQLGKWFKNPSPLLDSWGVSLGVSRFPFPNEDKKEVEIHVHEHAEVHLWGFDPILDGKIKTRDGMCCFASAWSHNFSDTGWRVLRTARGLDIPMKQYRTDLTRVVEDQWGRLVERGMV